MQEPLEPTAKLAYTTAATWQVRIGHTGQSGRVKVQIARRSQLHQAHAQRPDCGMHLCLAGKNRRLWKTCKHLLHTSLQFVHLVFLALLVLKTMSGSQQYLRRITCCQSTSKTKQAFPAASTPMPDGGLESVQSPFHVCASGSRRTLQPGPSVLARGQ